MIIILFHLAILLFLKTKIQVLHQKGSTKMESIFESPLKVVSGNGGGFTSDEFTRFYKNLNLKISTVQLESPWSKGICERHYTFLTDMILEKRDKI